MHTKQVVAPVVEALDSRTLIHGRENGNLGPRLPGDDEPQRRPLKQVHHFNDTPGMKLAIGRSAFVDLCCAAHGHGTIKKVFMALCSNAV